MNIQIKNRFSDAVIFGGEYESVKAAVVAAVKARADLTGAYLAGANLTDADLADADLAGANLAGANLADADLTGAYLTGANLADADLTGANLTDADLTGAYLTGANLADAKNAPKTDGTEAIQEPADRRERLAARAARFRERNPTVPVVEALDAKILKHIEAGTGILDMRAWHGPEDKWCGTTHCRAGWAIHEAGPPGKALQDKYGPQRAGAMIYRASTGRVPHFFATNERALEDIKACAAEQSAS